MGWRLSWGAIASRAPWKAESAVEPLGDRRDFSWEVIEEEKQQEENKYPEHNAFPARTSPCSQRSCYRRARLVRLVMFLAMLFGVAKEPL